MNNYELSRLIVDDIMKKINAGEQVFYMEYVRSVESLLNKHAAQQNVQRTGLTAEQELQSAIVDAKVKAYSDLNTPRH